MADKKVSDLTSLAQADGEDLLLIVSDPVGAPASRKITVSDFFGNVSVVTTHTANVIFESGVSFTGALALDTETTFNDETTFAAGMTTSNTFTVNGGAQLQSDVISNADLNANGTLTVTGVATFSSSMIATGNTSIVNLTVDNTSVIIGSKYGDPTSANASNEGVSAGSIFFSDEFLYIAVDENTLKRVALSTFTI